MFHAGGDIGQASREAVAGYLQVLEVFQPRDEIVVAGRDCLDANVHVTCLPVKLVPQLPPRGKNCDHVAADDAVVLSSVAERPRYVRERDVAKVVSN